MPLGWKPQSGPSATSQMPGQGRWLLLRQRATGGRAVLKSLSEVMSGETGRSGREDLESAQPSGIVVQGDSSGTPPLRGVDGGGCITDRHQAQAAHTCGP